MSEKSKLQRRWSIWRRKIARNAMFWPALSVALLVIILDQISKKMVLANPALNTSLCSPLNERFCGMIEVSSYLNLKLMWNTGVSFSLFAGGLVSRISLTALSLTICVFLLIWLGSLRRRVAAIGIGFIIGGALGNTLDRIVYGAVVDFLDFSGLVPFFPYVFNIADTAINIGVACLAWDAFFGEGAKLARQSKAQNKAKKAA